MTRRKTKLFSIPPCFSQQCLFGNATAVIDRYHVSFNTIKKIKSETKQQSLHGYTPSYNIVLKSHIK